MPLGSLPGTGDGRRPAGSPNATKPIQPTKAKVKGLPPEVRRTSSGIRADDAMPLVGAAAGGIGTAAIVYFVIAPFTGVLGFMVLAYVSFLGLYAVLVSMDGDRELVKDRVAAAIAQSLGLTMLVGLVVVVGFTMWQGREVLTHGNFYSEDMSVTGPKAALDQGGIAHAALGTLIMIAISLAITIPLGLLCAVFLSETRGAFPRFVRTLVEAMTALPSIVAGLFVYAAIVMLKDSLPWVGQSGLAASIALSVMMLPIIIRASDVVLRLVPGNLKEAAEALGAPRWRVVLDVTLPTARSGLMTAIILGTARGIGETSPVLLTAGAATGFNLNPLQGPMTSLPLATFTMTRSPEPGFVARGFGAATVLMLIVLVLFVAARLLGGRAPGDLSTRQRRRRARQSAEDLRYYELLAASDARRGAAADPSSTRADSDEVSP